MADGTDNEKPASKPGSLTYAAPAARSCDDELTVIAHKIKPLHRRFADAILQGESGAAAAKSAGCPGTALRQAASRLLRREDVLRYIRLSQQRAATASQVTLEALMERLWLTVTDPTATEEAQERAMAHLVKLHSVGRGIVATSGLTKTEPATELDADAGLPEDLAAKFERTLGVRR